MKPIHYAQHVDVQPNSGSLTGFVRPIVRALVGLLLTSIIAGGAAAAEPSTKTELPVSKLQIGSKSIMVEVASDDQQMQKGLMFRPALGQDQGMVFVFPQVNRHCMWMRNTLIPLDVAFIDERGVIVNIEAMQPLSEASHCSSKPTKFALEMNVGWFDRAKVKPGDKIGAINQLVPR